MASTTPPKTATPARSIQKAQQVARRLRREAFAVLLVEAKALRAHWRAGTGARASRQAQATRPGYIRDEQQVPRLAPLGETLVHVRPACRATAAAPVASSSARVAAASCASFSIDMTMSPMSSVFALAGAAARSSCWMRSLRTSASVRRAASSRIASLVSGSGSFCSALSAALPSCPLACDAAGRNDGRGGERRREPPIPQPRASGRHQGCR